jgi:hypothetical protein
MNVVWDGIGDGLLCSGRSGSGFRVVAETGASAGWRVLPVSVGWRKD